MGKIHWRRNRLPTPVLLGFPCGSAGKESACKAGNLGSIPGLGRSLGEGKGYLLQYSGLENSMDYCPWGQKKSDTTEQLSLHFTSLHFKLVYEQHQTSITPVNLSVAIFLVDRAQPSSPLSTSLPSASLPPLNPWTKCSTAILAP